MKMLVLGAGLQGSACAFDLLRLSKAAVTVADAEPGLPGFLERVRSGRLRELTLDAADEGAVLDVMRRHDAVLSALPYYLNDAMARLAVAAGVHFADLGGNTEIVRRQEMLDAAARERGISIVPDVGLAPGMVNVLAAEAIRRLDRAEMVRMYVGGLPRHPEPPLDYQVVYSLEGALDYYTTPSWILRGGEPVQVEALSEVESVTFPEPLATLEAFHTGGGVSTMPWVFAGRVGGMEYKTLRYPGHAAIMRAIRDLGLLSTEPVPVNGVAVRPRDVFIRAVEPKLRRPDAEDVVALRVVAEGTARGERACVGFQVMDCYDAEHGVSAMMRTTGYSLAITGLMQVEGRVTGAGVRPAYLATPFEPYVAALAERGIRITEP